jgi:uncharacterized protein YecE (DUF72 family)
MVTAQQEYRIGTAGWNIPKQLKDDFPGEGSHLERYASRFSSVEINSSFYRPHRRSTYERWAQTVPTNFRFSVKLPKEITHRRKLVDCVEPLDHFLEESSGLGNALGPILVQLPPSLSFGARAAATFFEAIRSRFEGQIACEPRHPSWFNDEAERTLMGFRIARVAADPPVVSCAKSPGGWPELVYFRLHGAPKTYSSPYSELQLDAYASAIQYGARGGSNWCIFDNTTLGEAAGNALTLISRL